MKTLVRTIRVGPYLADHRFLGRAVLPGVEALQLLAGEVKAEYGLDVSQTDQAEFLKFLVLPKEPTGEVIVEMEEMGDRVSAGLCSRTGSKSGAMTRKLEHVRGIFGPGEGPVPSPIQPAASLDGALSIRPTDIYLQAVPLGPAFQNIIGPVHLTADGAVAEVRARDTESLPGPLGSPFPLDAAFQVACLWGERFHCLVGFPVGFARRRVFRPTEAGRDYHAWISSGRPDGDEIVFDIRLQDQSGRVMETAEGLRMKDVSRGRLKPPDWLTGEESAPFS